MWNIWENLGDLGDEEEVKRQWTRAQLEQIVSNAAVKYGIDPQVAYAQVTQESAWNPRAGSSAGAQGLFQFIPATWQRYGTGSPYNPIAAAEAWGKYMSYLLRIFKGRYDVALAGYNSGENRAEYRNAVAQNRPINWAVMPRGVQNETKAYVARILRNARWTMEPRPTPVTPPSEVAKGGPVDVSTDAPTPQQPVEEKGAAAVPLLILAALLIVGVTLS